MKSLSPKLTRANFYCSKPKIMADTLFKLPLSLLYLSFLNVFSLVAIFHFSPNYYNNPLAVGPFPSQSLLPITQPYASEIQV